MAGRQRPRVQLRAAGSSTPTTRSRWRRRSRRWWRSVASALWRERADDPTPGSLLAVGVLLTAGWSWVLLDRTPQWESWLRAVDRGERRSGRGRPAGGLAAAAARATGHHRRPRRWPSSPAWPGRWPTPPRPSPPPTPDRSVPAGPSSGGAGGPRGGGAGGGGAAVAAGSAAVASRSPAGLVKALQAGAGKYRWVAAVSGSQSAARSSWPPAAAGDGHRRLRQRRRKPQPGPVQAVRRPRRDPLLHRRRQRRRPPGGQPQRCQSRPQRVHAARRWGRPGGFGGQGGSSSTAITTWVKAHYKSQAVGGETVYNLTAKAST